MAHPLPHPHDGPAAPQPSGDRDTARAGWASPLAAATTTLLAVATASGLWMLFAPFSTFSQIVVLLHVVAGLALVVPAFWYLLRHIAAWHAQPATATMAFGYLLAAGCVTCLASGAVVTWDAAFGSGKAGHWSSVHEATGLAVALLLPAHLVGAWLRRRPAARRDPLLARARKRFAVGAAAASALLAGSALALSALTPSPPRALLDLPPDYAMSPHVQSFAEFGDSPFAPSHARTASGLLLDPALLSGSRACGTGGCHEEILAEWEPSAHRFAAMNPPFQHVQREFAAERGAVEVRYCAGCHDPISLFAGAKDIHQLDLAAPGMDEGVSCIVCHTISAVDQRGNADYVLTPPRRYLYEDADGGWRQGISDFLIRAYPRQHLADYDRNVLRTPEFCGACHKQYIPEVLNRFGTSPGQNQFDEWRNSHWNTDHHATNLSCRDCHMRLVHDSRDPARGEGGDRHRSPHDGAHRHHGTIATNVWMPRLLDLPHADEQVRLTEEWIRGETVVPEIAHLWPPGPVATLRLLAPASAAPGEDIVLRVIVENVKAGHNLTTGPLDFIRCWVHVRVEDAAGALVAEWGGLDPTTRAITDAPGVPHMAGRPRDEGALVLEGIPTDAEGADLRRHELWRKAGGRGNRVLFPRTADSHVHRLRIPSDAVGPLRITADLNYRRYRQEFLDLVLPGLEERTGVFQPVVTKTSAAATLPLRAAAGAHE